METKKCPKCGEPFVPNHGNRVYCSTKCYQDFSREKQKQNNDIIKQFRGGFLANYMYLRDLLAEPGSLTIPLLNLLKRGFDQAAYYGTVIDKNKVRWHKVNEYMFNIEKRDSQLIINLRYG